MSRYNSIINLYGKDNYDKIKQAKILIVGAGGIGCEILKNMALIGFRYIELIDLDTIDVSNLNRQFLFRPEHVGQSKAIIAGKAAKLFNPDIEVISHHKNIKENQFNIDYYSKFNLVLNALDNVDARRHVNRLCLAANIPLIDSGTTGYLGQVMPIFKKVTACYECFPKPTQKVYPLCTIRNTPDKPVHCIDWAKECFELLFGNMSESRLFEDETNTEETSVYMSIVKQGIPLNTNNQTESSVHINKLIAYGKVLLLALFHHEVQKQIDMNLYATAIQPPQLLSEDIIHTTCELALQSLLNNDIVLPTSTKHWDQKIFTLEENIIQFLICLYEISLNDTNLIGSLSFDKDDVWAMKFITVTSNLRSYLFSIPLQSYHDAKGIAGNIIPAIATTNAIISAIQVKQAISIILNTNKEIDIHNQKICSQIYCLRHPTRKGLYLQPTSVDAPVNTCYVCNTAVVTLQVDVTQMIFGDLIQRIIKAKLGFVQPSIMHVSNLLYEEGEDVDDDFAMNLSKILSELPSGGIQHGAQLIIDDFLQSLEVQLIIKHVSNEELKQIPSLADELYILNGIDAFQQKQMDDLKASTSEISHTNMDDDFIIITDSSNNTNNIPISTTTTTLKRGINEVIIDENNQDTNLKKNKI